MIASGPSPFPTFVRSSGCPVAHDAPPSSDAFVKCPHLKAQAEAAKPARPLAYTHEYEGTKAANPAYSEITPEKWENAKHFDVVVVGGGIGGLYTAWKLQGCDGSKSERPKIGMFERTAHLGGRLHTAKVAGVAHPMDVGAMRYLPSENPLLQGLTDRFGIATEKFVVHGDANLNYFRGQRNTQAEGAAVLPYHLRPEEQGKSPEQLLLKAFEVVVPGFATLSKAELEKAIGEARLGGAPLHQVGLQNVLSKTLSQEAIQLITDTEGYQSDLQNWDAGRAMLELAPGLRGTEVEYRVPKEGMNAFYEALQTDLSRTPTEIRMGRPVRELDYDATTKQFKLIVDGDQPVTADKVVLNLPKVPLQELVGNSPFLQHTPLEEGLEKVEANPLTRIFATYEKPWWNDMGIQGGRSLTDLNLGQVYYYGSGDDDKFKKPYLEVYNDGTRSEFWEGLQNPGDPGVTTRLNVQPQLAEELQKELEEMHGQELPKPTGLLYKRWADPYMGAGWHTWNPGTKPTESSEAMIAPLPGLPLYVTGEAWSTNQGWVEGALETSEKVVAKIKNGA